MMIYAEDNSKKSKTSIYHIMVRNINRLNISVNDEELDEDTLKQLSRLSEFTVKNYGV